MLLMFMILLMHCFLNTGLLVKGIFEDINSEIAWIIEALSIVAVNCYILISGYFLIDSKCDTKKVLKLITQVLMYSLGIFIIFKICKWNISLKDTLRLVLPITLKTYWFVTCYIILYLIAPFLNIIIKNTSKEQIEKLIIIITLISWLSTILYYLGFDVIDATKGYGILWFINLYLIAGYIKLYVNKNYNKNQYLIIYIIVSLIVYATRVMILMMNKNKILSSDVFYNYNTITITISSICLFMFFKNLKINNDILKSIILKISPLTFAVYIIHEHPLIKRILYKNIVYLNSLMNGNIIVIIFIACIIIYIISCTIEYIRTKMIKIIKSSFNKSKTFNKIKKKMQNCDKV